LTQVPGYGTYLYGLSLISPAQRDNFQATEQQVIQAINAGAFTEAFHVSNEQ
jgi:hypothetical protein